MKITHTTASPILLKLVPENVSDIIENGMRFNSLKDMGVPVKIKKKNGTLLINIDPDGWKDFDEHS
jgi:hypothetical protein